jgi:hypothetical protein
VADLLELQLLAVLLVEIAVLLGLPQLAEAEELHLMVVVVYTLVATVVAVAEVHLIALHYILVM